MAQKDNPALFPYNFHCVGLRNATGANIIVELEDGVWFTCFQARLNQSNEPYNEGLKFYSDVKYEPVQYIEPNLAMNNDDVNQFNWWMGRVIFQGVPDEMLKAAVYTG